MDGFDRETGEVMPETARGMPIEIVKAVVAVASKVKMLGADSKNEHGKYNYVSIDKFLEVVGPIMADAGLVLTQDEVSAEVRELGATANAPGKPFLFVRYAFGLAHTSGQSWGPSYRSVALQALGPQSFGAAESYMMKRFLRGIFMVPTGDADADAEQQGGLAPGRATASPARQNNQSRSNAAPPASPPAGPPPERAEAQQLYREVRSEIEASMTAPELDHLKQSGLWERMAAALKKAEPQATIDELLLKLDNQIANRRDMIMADGEYR